MGRVTVKLDDRALNNYMQVTARKAAQNAAHSAQRKIRRNMASRTNTGAMQRSVKTKKIRDGWYKVYSDLYYAVYQNDGIGPVYPRTKKALRFKPKGSSSYVFARRTRGFPGGQFFERAARSLRLKDFMGN